MSAANSNNDSQASENTTFKVMLVGNSAVGKTAWSARQRTGEFSKQHTPSSDILASSYPLPTTTGQITVDLWDTDSTSSAKEESYNGAHGVIVMFNLTDASSFASVPGYIEMIRRATVRPDGSQIPIVVAGSHCDEKDENWKVSNAQLHEMVAKYAVTYYHVSAKSNFNFEKPILSLLRRMTGDEKLNLVEAEALLPPEVSAELLAQLSLNDAANVADEEEDDDEDDEAEEDEVEDEEDDAEDMELARFAHVNGLLIFEKIPEEQVLTIEQINALRLKINTELVACDMRRGMLRGIRINNSQVLNSLVQREQALANAAPTSS
jgi:GTP-binding nuclear protein Ran